jgi:O-antigen/teichoic acid export membrane protein
MIAFNAASQMMALGSILILQTIYMIVVARVIGPEDFGRFSFAWSVVQIMLIGGDLGLHNTAVRNISARLDDSLLISRTFFWLKGLLACLLLFLVLLIALALPETFETRLTLAIFGIGMFFHSMSAAMNVVFQAHGKLYFGSLNVFLVFVLQAAFGLTALYMGGGIVFLGLAYLVGAGLASLVNLLIFTQTIHSFRLGKSSDWRSFAFESIPVGVSTLFHTISSRIGVTLVTVLVGPYQTGIFSAAVRIPQALGNIPGGIFSALLPAMAAHQSDPRPVKRLFRYSLLLMIGCALPLALAFYFFAGPVILLIYGEEYVASIANLRILTWSLIPVFLGMAFSHVILSQHRLVGKLPWVTGAALMVNVVANFILIPRFESLGASYGLLLTELALAVGYVLATRSYLSRSDKLPKVSTVGQTR